MKSIVFVILLFSITLALESTYSWNDAVVYEIFVRSFYDSDGDGIGDLKGIELKLDYLQELGVNTLWLMPIFQSPSYHGYDVTNYYRIDEDYGTMDDFDSLLEQCESRNIRIILDLVINHTSSNHPWFKQSIQQIAAPPSFFVPFLSNHDQDRYFTTLGKDFKKAKLALAIMFTAPGTPFMYYGEEVGMHQSDEGTGHGSVRIPMQWNDSTVTAGFTSANVPWHAIGDNKNPYNLTYQQNTINSLWKLYQKLIRLRKTHPAFRYGNYRFYDMGEQLLCYKREHEEQTVLVLINASKEKQPIKNKEILGKYQNLLNNRLINIEENFLIQPQSFHILISE